MFSKILLGIEVLALIAAPFGYLKLRANRAERFFNDGEVALQEGDWDQAYACYQEAARRKCKTVSDDATCRLTLCKDFGLGIVPIAQLENCPLHGVNFADCFKVGQVPPKRLFEAAKQNLFESGSPDVIVWVATAYKDGYSAMPQAYDEAVEWYRVAALQGHLEAQSALVDLVVERKWKPEPKELPTNWLLNVAGQGNPRAEILLGERVATGDTTLTHYPKVADWLFAAAEHQAAGNKCITLPQSEDMSIEWYCKAATLGHTGAQARLARLVHRKSSNLTPKDLPTSWLLNVYHDSWDAGCLLGERLAAGNETLAQHSDALYWLFLAALDDDEKAQGCLGAKFAKWKLDGKDLQMLMLIRDWDSRRATQLDGVLLLFLNEGINNFIFNYIMKAAKQNKVDAQIYLGNLIAEGKWDQGTAEEQFNYLKASAETGNAKAQYALGMCYRHGKGVQESKERAREWLQKAADNGDRFAPRMLHDLERLDWLHDQIFKK